MQEPIRQYPKITLDQAIEESQKNLSPEERVDVETLESAMLRFAESQFPEGFRSSKHIDKRDPVFRAEANRFATEDPERNPLIDPDRAGQY